MTDIEIGGSKRARRGYSLDDIAIVPTRRTRDAEEVSTAWPIDAYRSTSHCWPRRWIRSCRPTSAATLAGLGGLAVLNLEGLWTRYEDPEPLLAEIAALDAAVATPRLQEIYAARPSTPTWSRRASELKPAGTRSLSPLAAAHGPTRPVSSRASTSSSSVAPPSRPSMSPPTGAAQPEGVHRRARVPVIVGGCATYQTALHLMRTGAAGVLVGFGGGASTPPPTSRRPRPDGLGHRRRRRSPPRLPRRVRRPLRAVIADGAMGRSGDIAKAWPAERMR